MMCVECKFGHDCPYFDGIDDMYHALLPYSNDDVDRIINLIDVNLALLKEAIKSGYVSDDRFDFDLNIGLAQCSGFEAY